LSNAKADITAALGNPCITSNPNVSDINSTINNYIADAQSKIATISWLDAWNRDLILARAIEWAKEWVLQPIIDSGNTSITIKPNCLTRTDLWTTQASWAGSIWEEFRNMGVVSLDYVTHRTEPDHVTRAIAIPAWLNTFWSSESDPK
jgi:hypothetical protein